METKIGDPNDRTYTIEIKNTSDVKQKVVLFGSTRAIWKNLNSKFVKINVLESSYDELIADLLSTIIEVKIRYRAKDKAQFENPMRWIKSWTTGAEETRIIQPINYYNPEKSDIHIFECDGFIIDKLTRCEFDINPKEEIEIQIQLLSKTTLEGTRTYK